MWWATSTGVVVVCRRLCFFFNDTATTEIYTLSLHDALPIYSRFPPTAIYRPEQEGGTDQADRKSTRLNSSHLVISYAVFCLKKKTKHKEVGLSTGWRYSTMGKTHGVRAL